MALLSTSPDKQIGGNIKSATSKKLSNTNVSDGPKTTIHSTDNLKTFMSFFCDRHSIEMATTIKSSINLFNYCIPARGAVLTLYSELFNEYSIYYWITRRRTLAPAGDPGKSRIEYVGELTRRFYEMAKLKLADAREDQHSDFGGTPRASNIVRASPTKSASSIAGPASPTASQSCSSPTTAPKIIPTGPRIIPVSRRTSSCNSHDDNEQTPMSPSGQDSEASLEDGIQYESEVNVVDIFPELENLISQIRSALSDLIRKYTSKDKEKIESTSHTTLSNDRQGGRLRDILNSWASELLIQLNIKHSEVAIHVATNKSKGDPTNLLSNEIELWLGNPVNKLLVDLLLESHNDIQSLFNRLINSTQNCDWLLAHILLEMSRRPNYEQDFSSCMEYIIGCQSAVKSVTHILAYLSDTNPRAMANFPKSNIPFLISLCQTSSSLLNVLAQEIPDTIDPDFLNNLAKEAYNRFDNKTHPPCVASLTHCIIAAPNSYKLFLLALEVKLDDRVSSEVKAAAQLIIDSILIKIHERAIDRTTAQTMLNHGAPTHLIDSLLDQINNDLPKLIEKSVSSKFIEKKAQEIFYRMSLIYGDFFASKVICHYLNLPEGSFWSLLKPLLTKFMKHFGDDGSTLVSQTLSLDSDLRRPVYWTNIYTLTTMVPELKLNLELISQLLIDKLCAATFDIVSVAQLIKLSCNSIERVDHTRISISTKHRLCLSLATSYFLLLEYESDNFPEILSYIRISLTCMSLLKQSSVASHILCRALLERSLVYGHLFNDNFNPDLIGDGNDSYDWTHDDSIKLCKENLKVTLGHRFRRLPNHLPERAGNRTRIQNNIPKDPNKPDKRSINSYLLIEAFKSSINNIEAFATLFVEFHCPVMFDKLSWPNDEALRVINERNLSILRKFEQIPILWDLYELIGQAGCLKSCLVLVKALLAAHLALWASATTKSSPDKMISTSRLIPPLAQSKLVPEAFGLTVEVFPHLDPNEVFSVLSDIWQYLKDTNSNGNLDTELSPEDKTSRAKTYLNRLRLFMCQHIPGPLYVKIFKDFYTPVSN